MKGRPLGTDAWDRLHEGTDREGLDSPARFVLTGKPVVLPVRSAVRQVPVGAQVAEPGRARAARGGSHRRAAPVTDVPGPTRPADGAGRPGPVPPEQTRGTTTSVRPRMIMRPYARTGGRTCPDYDLALEALVSTTERARLPQAVSGVQYRRICGLCCEPRSIAEIAAYLSLPLNVVKVLVSDLDNDGLVMIHQSGLSFGDRSSREFMDRVLQGLRRL